MILRKLGGRGGEGIGERAIEPDDSGDEGFGLFGFALGSELFGPAPRGDPLALKEPLSPSGSLEPVAGEASESPRKRPPR